MGGSHLSTFRARPWEETCSLISDICNLQSEILVEGVRNRPGVRESPKIDTTDRRTTGSLTQVQENGVHNQHEESRWKGQSLAYSTSNRKRRGYLPSTI